LHNDWGVIDVESRCYMWQLLNSINKQANLDKITVSDARPGAS